MPELPRAFEIGTADGVTLVGEAGGEGMPVVLLHGLTATHRYVVMGSRLLEREGHRVIAYDARGHGGSSPAPNADAYSYELLANDLLRVFDTFELQGVVVAGASMGAQTALRFALEYPERVAALCLITPAFDPEAQADYGSWERLARGLREGGVEGFVAAYDLDVVPEQWRETVLKVMRQRLSAHEHPLAVADALEAVPRSRPFERWQDLATIVVPTLVVASRDQADLGHPLAVAERYAQAIPDARLVVEEEGPPAQSPIAWQGGRLSKLIVALVQEACGK